MSIVGALSLNVAKEEIKNNREKDLEGHFRVPQEAPRFASGAWISLNFHAAERRECSF